MTAQLLRRAVPGGNGFIESFNSCLRDGLLDDEILYTLKEAKIVVESWRRYQRGTTARSAIVHRRCSCPRSPRGRLYNPGQLRRPCTR